MSNKHTNEIQDPYHEALVLIRVEKLRIEGNREERTKLEAEFRSAVKELHRAKKDRRRFSTEKFAETYPDEYKTVFERFQTRAQELGQKWNSERDQYEAMLKSLAEKAVIPRTAEASKMPEFMYDAAYSSQGLGQHKYAHESAQHVADHAAACGVEAFVKCPGKTGDHEVWAHCDPEAWPIVKAKPGQSLKDWIKSCWGRGVNPRVFMPGLPVGLEEKLGLDYFGNEK